MSRGAGTAGRILESTLANDTRRDPAVRPRRLAPTTPGTGAVYYPARLRRRIVALNRSVLDPDDPFFYVNQVASAVDRSDLVAVNHRVAAWLASYFDVLFAVNRALHPGEKRLVAFAQRECNMLPADFATDVDDLLRLTCAPNIQIVDRMKVMVQRLDEVIGDTAAERPPPASAATGRSGRA